MSKKPIPTSSPSVKNPKAAGRQPITIQPQSAARLRDPRHLRNRHLVDRHGGEVSAGRTCVAGRRLRHHLRRRGVAARGAHRRVRRGHLDQPRPAPGPQAAAAPAGDRPAGDKMRESSGGLALVPLSMYFSDGKVKVELGLARGKKEYDKRQTPGRAGRRPGARPVRRATGEGHAGRVGPDHAGPCVGAGGWRPRVNGARCRDHHVHWVGSYDMGVIGLDSGCRVRRSGPRKATMISLTIRRKKSSADNSQREFALAA